jgi:hypothetical protein
MKPLVGMLAALLVSASPAVAQTATGTGTATSSSNSGAVAVANGGGGGSAQAGGGSASVVFNTPGSTRSDTNSRIRQSGSLNTTPSVGSVSLGGAAVETCYGPGVSAGLGVTGFGASFGAGQYDQACARRLNARTLYAFGLKGVALRIMAQDPDVYNAMLAEGMIRPEPGDRGYVGAVGYAPAARRVNAGCRKWSGGAQGVGSCVYY